ncbi:P-loop containing nucleoside triphosphate hydrolase protein [Fusarium tricinctum]|uniref:ATP-dependent RNA helicase n=1 Tax=Fusarium tricinctum TaxID=61284 RepID=A0A8K0RT59_9HYPO|nr:P-loop containing nucleoside triphosphate hydrolase protein [Fusarium tricinctum]
MADDGMLLNFDLGSGPVKPQVKFKGGRWRDRKQAEKSARLASGKPSQPKPSGDGPEEGRSSKRQRTDDVDYDDDFDSKSLNRFNARPRHGDSDGHGGAHSGQPRNHQPDGKSRQVISRLFSFNPAQTTEAEEKQGEWTAPEATNAPLSDVANFGTLTISARLVEELGKMNLERPTAIQNKVIPHMLTSSSDAFVQAETGSGKTLAYLLPILHRVLQLSEKGKAQIHRDSGAFAIIVAPTRELAKQVHTVLEKLIRPFPWLVSTAITGGESKKAEKARIRKGVNFLVATPGRLADHIDNTKALNLSTVRWLILDEGDRLMDLGFEEDLKKVITTLKSVDESDKLPDGTPLKALPERRVTVLCSATMKMNVQKLGEMSLADATFIAAKKEDMEIDMEKSEMKAPAQLHQYYSVVPAKLRLVTLMSYLKSTFSRRGKTMKAIVFISCADSVDFHYELLRDPNSGTVAPDAAAKEAEAISRTVGKAAYITSPASPEVILHRMHGSLSQPIRTATLRSFSACKSPSLLITTDVSSRGLDIPSVDLVIEYDPAFSFADHIHRVGRTARAGRPGDAMLFLLPGTEEGYIELLKASTPPTPQSYDSILQKGMMTKLEFPVETPAKPEDGQSFHNKAESLQLHIEQRLLEDAKRLELARNGFKSHIRAYATHTKEERKHFDISELHLGHTAKSYGLREAPGGIGAGVERKTKKRTNRGVEKDPEQAAGDERQNQNIIRKKSMMLMNSAADEFNIG